MAIAQPAFEIRRIAHSSELFHVEDACDVHGGTLGYNLFGIFGDVLTFCFYASHRMTNCVCPMAMIVITTFDHKGFNMKSTEIQASLGIPQLKKLRLFTRTWKAIVLALKSDLEDSGVTDSISLPEPIMVPKPRCFPFQWFLITDCEGTRSSNPFRADALRRDRYYRAI